MTHKILALNIEGVIGDFLDDADKDLPYNIIEDLAEHLKGWMLAHKKEILETLNNGE